MTRHRHPADDGGDAALVAGVDEAEVFELRVSSELGRGREVVVDGDIMARSARASSTP